MNANNFIYKICIKPWIIFFHFTVTHYFVLGLLHKIHVKYCLVCICNVKHVENFKGFEFYVIFFKITYLCVFSPRALNPWGLQGNRAQCDLCDSVVITKVFFSHLPSEVMWGFMVSNPFYRICNRAYACVIEEKREVRCLDHEGNPGKSQQYGDTPYGLFRTAGYGPVRTETDKHHINNQIETRREQS